VGSYPHQQRATSNQSQRRPHAVIENALSSTIDWIGPIQYRYVVLPRLPSFLSWPAPTPSELLTVQSDRQRVRDVVQPSLVAIGEAAQ